MFGKKHTVVTHNGGFHADDAFSVATLHLLLGGRIRVVRSRDPRDISRADYVVDVGGEYDPARKIFDHHQKGGAGARANGIPYAAFGLVWREYGAQISGSQEAADKVDAILVQPIDAGDNGFPIAKSLVDGAREYGVARAISVFEGEEDSAALYRDFMRASEWARGVLSREIARARETVLGEKKARAAYDAASDKRVIVMEAEYAWHDVFSKMPEPLFAIYPDKVNKTWHAKAVQAEMFVQRKPFPESWAGLRDADLAKASGVPDAVFCHNKRFLAVAKSREGALRLAELALAS